MTVRIGTRGSKLALWQAHLVQHKLEQSGLKTEIVIIKTKGDKILDRALSKIGSKGVFTEELESQLLEQKIDIAVHSAKDVPSTLPNDLPLLAFTQREQANDVLVSLDPQVSTNQKDLIVGTSSTRRVALLKHYHPHIKTVDMRGNLQTRLKKLKEGQCDALLLAFAGVHRMDYGSYIVEHLSLDTFVPAVGQGSVAVQVFEGCDDELKTQIKKAINDPDTETCLRAERQFLKTLDGGCSIPVFGLARLQDNNLLLKGGIVSLNGKELLDVQASFELDDNLHAHVERLAQELLAKGGQRILNDIRAAQ